MACSDDIPALLGGPPARAGEPPEWPVPDPEILLALERAYHDRSWGKYYGPHCQALETLLREYHGSEHVVLCGSGTFAVELALRALQVGPGDEVLLAAYDFPGNFHAVHAVGAFPVLVDVAAGNWNLSFAALEKAATDKVRALIVSHLHGGLVPMALLMAWARQRHIAVVEDAAQSPGAVLGDKKAGTWGDAGVLSFGGSKLLTAGRGGALLTARADVAQRARTWLFRGNLVCPLSELQAAVLPPQLAKLDQRNQVRRHAVQTLANLLADLPGLHLFQNQEGVGTPTYYKVGFQFDAEAFGLERAVFLAAARAEGLALDEGFAGLHVGRSPRRFRAGTDLDEATRAHRSAVILHHPVLLEDVDHVAAGIRKIHRHAAALYKGGTP